MHVSKPMDAVQLKAVRTTIRAGISEILLGFVLLVFGVLFYFATPLAAFGALFPVLLNPIAKYLNRRFVVPRIGYAKAVQQPRVARGILTVAVSAIVGLLCALGIFSLIKGFSRGYILWLDYFVPATGGVLMAIGPWVIARTYKLFRWYVLAALFAIGGVAVPLLDIAKGYEAISLESAILGALALIYGVILFLTFLATYPVQEIDNGA